MSEPNNDPKVVGRDAQAICALLDLQPALDSYVLLREDAGSCVFEAHASGEAALLSIGLHPYSGQLTDVKIEYNSSCWRDEDDLCNDPDRLQLVGNQILKIAIHHFNRTAIIGRADAQEIAAEIGVPVTEQVPPIRYAAQHAISHKAYRTLECAYSGGVSLLTLWDSGAIELTETRVSTGCETRYFLDPERKVVQIVNQPDGSFECREYPVESKVGNIVRTMSANCFAIAARATHFKIA